MPAIVCAWLLNNWSLFILAPPAPLSVSGNTCSRLVDFIMNRSKINFLWYFYQGRTSRFCRPMKWSTSIQLWKSKYTTLSNKTYFFTSVTKTALCSGIPTWCIEILQTPFITMIIPGFYSQLTSKSPHLTDLQDHQKPIIYPPPSTLYVQPELDLPHYHQQQAEKLNPDQLKSVAY